MKKKNIRFMVVMGMMVALSGCALPGWYSDPSGGHAISRDEMEGYTDRDFKKVWEVSLRVLETEGEVLVAEKSLGHIEARIEGSSLKVQIDQISEGSTRFRVGARKMKRIFADRKRAREIFNKIIRAI